MYHLDIVNNYVDVIRAGRYLSILVIPRYENETIPAFSETIISIVLVFTYHVWQLQKSCDSYYRRQEPNVLQICNHAKDCNNQSTGIHKNRNKYHISEKLLINF